MSNRFEGRAVNALRVVEIIADISPYAEGSCLIKCGNTHVLCTASVEENVPRWIKEKERRNPPHGWVTAEYGMLPRATHTRMGREARGRGQSGRTQEIQRLIGRSLRAAIDLKMLGGRQILVDCDVIQADGGTRTASITGGWVAMKLACRQLLLDKKVHSDPVHSIVTAVSCGIVDDVCVLDMDYQEDSHTVADANFVFADKGMMIEIQASAEKRPFNTTEFSTLLELAHAGTRTLCELQKKAVNL